MKNTINQEYQVLVTHLPLGESNGRTERWRAAVLGFPLLAEEAVSREQALSQLQAKLVELSQHSELATVSAPALLPRLNEPDALHAQGWDDHGLFKDDPEALRLFDEIEQARDSQMVGGA